jgi:hypothetical protein
LGDSGERLSTPRIVGWAGGMPPRMARRHSAGAHAVSQATARRASGAGTTWPSSNSS